MLHLPKEKQQVVTEKTEKLDPTNSAREEIADSKPEFLFYTL